MPQRGVLDAKTPRNISLEILSTLFTVTVSVKKNTGRITKLIAVPWGNERSYFEQP
jgi:hypothetical protein